MCIMCKIWKFRFVMQIKPQVSAEVMMQVQIQ